MTHLALIVSLASTFIVSSKREREREKERDGERDMQI
jgi:hypothetical protein